MVAERSGAVLVVDDAASSSATVGGGVEVGGGAGRTDPVRSGAVASRGSVGESAAASINKPRTTRTPATAPTLAARRRAMAEDYCTVRDPAVRESWSAGRTTGGIRAAARLGPTDLAIKRGQRFVDTIQVGGEPVEVGHGGKHGGGTPSVVCFLAWAAIGCVGMIRILHDVEA